MKSTATVAVDKNDDGRDDDNGGDGANGGDDTNVELSYLEHRLHCCKIVSCKDELLRCHQR